MPLRQLLYCQLTFSNLCKVTEPHTQSKYIEKINSFFDQASLAQSNVAMKDAFFEKRTDLLSPFMQSFRIASTNTQQK